MTDRPDLRPNRRHILTGAAALAGMVPGLAMAQQQGQNVAAAPIEGTEDRGQIISPYGTHQAGIVTPRPAHGMVASFHVIAADAEALENLFRRLTQRIDFLTHGGAVPELDPNLPPADSGILGPVLRPDASTITVALGNSLFESRPWLAPLKPVTLGRMTKFRNDALMADICHGDLAIQFCANSQDTVVHALRDIVKSIPDQLVLKWAQVGNVPVIPPRADRQIESARNLLGFRDGSANPDSADTALMDRIVWADQGEPAWAAGGSYMAVRIIRNLVERWDRTPLSEQEAIFGRTKSTGAPLDKRAGTEADIPDYTADPDGEVLAMDSHIRLANPRGPDAERSLMLRRPFNYVNGVQKNGQMDQGLLFIAWQADLDRAFIAVQHRLDGEPLEEYIKPVGGGYFFALPGFSEGDDDYLGRSLIEAI